MEHVLNRQASLRDHVVGIYIYETCRSKVLFPSFRPKNLFIGKSRSCRPTVETGALNNETLDGNSTFLELSLAPECSLLVVTKSECNE